MVGTVLPISLSLLMLFGMIVWALYWNRSFKGHTAETCQPPSGKRPWMCRHKHQTFYWRWANGEWRGCSYRRYAKLAMGPLMDDIDELLRSR